MTGPVVDASVAVTQLLNQEHSERAEALFAASVGAGGESLVAPPLLPNEVTNALFQKTSAPSARE